MPSHFILLTVWGENSTCYSHSRVPNSLPDVGYRGHSSNLKKAAAAGKVSLLKQKRTTRPSSKNCASNLEQEPQAFYLCDFAAAFNFHPSFSLYKLLKM